MVIAVGVVGVVVFSGCKFINLALVSYRKIPKMEIRSVNPDTFLANEKSCLQLLKDTKNWFQIPSLNHTPLHKLADLSLVRFRGMIQDMSDPEIYLEKYEVRVKNLEMSRLRNGKYRDCLVYGPEEEVNMESNKNVHGDRRTIFVISVPGMNDWAVEHERTINNTLFMKENTSPTTSGGQKRAPDENESMDNDVVGDTIGTKRVCSEQNSLGKLKAVSNNMLSAEYLLNSPLPDRPSKAVMVKVYSNYDDFILNSIVDVVGFLSVDPILDSSTRLLDEYENMNEVHAANPPPLLIPRLHAIAVKSLTHMNPLLDESFLQSHDPLEAAGMVQKELQLILTQCLFGDSVAGDFLLSYMISTIFLRVGLQALGQFSLNICGIPNSCLPNYTTSLYDILQSLLPASYYFPMTLANMNAQQFLPKKDYSTNKLVSGLLQLAPQTHLILDETRLEPGKLEDNGVRGVQSLADLIKFQQIKANFQFFEITFDVNVPVLTFSEGRSMLPCDFQIPLKPDLDCIPLIEETLKAAKHYIQPKLNAVRKYLTSVKLLDFNINSDITEMIEGDFVEMRKQDKKFSSDELSSLLILSRLLATARGKVVLDKDVWNLAKSLQSEQRKRIQALPNRK